MAFLRCPCTSDDIKRRSVSLRCNATMPYHCMIDNKGELIEKCEEKTWIEPGLCAVYIDEARLVDTWKCRGYLGICPESRHFSNEALLYSACLNRGLVKPKVPAEKKDTNKTFTLEKWYSRVVVVVVLCPSTTYDIRSRAVLLGCNEELTYHCMSDRDGNIIEICLQRTWIQKGRCAVYDRRAQSVDALICSSHLGICPEKEYFTNDVILYSACISGRKTFSTTSPEREDTTEASTFDVKSFHAAQTVLFCPLAMATVMQQKMSLRCNETFKYPDTVNNNYVDMEEIGTCIVISPMIEDTCNVREFEIGFTDIEKCQIISPHCLRDGLMDNFDSNRIIKDKYTLHGKIMTERKTRRNRKRNFTAIGVTSENNFNLWGCGLGVSTAVTTTLRIGGSFESSNTTYTILVVSVMFILLTVMIFVYIRIKRSKGDRNTSEPSIETMSLEVRKSDEEE